jgi:peroxiredoxin
MFRARPLFLARKDAAVALEVGQAAPDFTLPSTSGSDVALASFRGDSNVLLAFFPLAFTSTCTAELCSFSADYPLFEALGTRVLPISVDSVPSLREFKAKERLSIDLLSDFKRDVCRLYDTLLADKFFSKRAYFLIDKSGVVRWTHTEAVLGHRRQDEELIAQIRTL